MNHRRHWRIQSFQKIKIRFLISRMQGLHMNQRVQWNSFVPRHASMFLESQSW
jgi:hypothetical protein